MKGNNIKALWLCPILLPEFAEHFGEKRNPKGGWLTGLFSGLKRVVQVDLCCPIKRCESWQEDVVHGTIVYSFKRTDDLVDAFRNILIASKPDIIHIWGTDKKSSLDMVSAAEELGLIENVVINIQAFTSLISRYHFYCFLPNEVIQSESPAEYKYGISLINQRDSMASRGICETKAFTKVKHVIGRTTYAYACVLQINPSLNFYQCYESLRESFYENHWKLENCERFSIFVSQSHWPVKGFHLMLEAMPLILKKFPTAKVYTTGAQPKVPETFEEKCCALAYPSYLAQLIADNHLEDHVEFVGTLGEANMCKRYLNSNVSVMCSSIEEESNSVAEAMLLGMPIVASNVGGVNNFIEHEKNGYLYQADAPYLLAYYVCKIFEDADAAIQMGNAAREDAEKYFDREANVRRMEEIYVSILDGAEE